MDPDDARRRALQNGQIVPPQAVAVLPSTVFRIDHMTGERVAYSSVGRGVDVFAEFPNSTPLPAHRLQNKGYVHGGNFQQDIPFVPIGVVTEAARTADTRGLDFLKLDPNTTPAPGSDTADKRKLRNGSAVFG